jgi:hypothetical protein
MALYFTFADPTAPAYVRPAHSTDSEKFAQAITLMLEGMSRYALRCQCSCVRQRSSQAHRWPLSDYVGPIQRLRGRNTGTLREKCGFRAAFQNLRQGSHGQLVRQRTRFGSGPKSQNRQAGFFPNLYVSCGMRQFECSDASSETYSLNKCFQQETRKSQGCNHFVRCLLQFLSSASDSQRAIPRHGSGAGRSCLDDC